MRQAVAILPTSLLPDIPLCWQASRNIVTGQQFTLDTLILQEPLLRVLVVDDNADAADALAALLTLFHCEVQVAYSGEDALALGNMHRPQCVLLDIMMPGMDGCQVARYMRACRWGREACLVALTANDDEQSRDRTMRAGIDFHLCKPVSAQALIDILEAIRASAPLRKESAGRL
ncbi:response regulator [Massilia sp. 9I]|uniref:response regulator n=1 Tax=Massilia sp. 9I TaxID=2653152 RepID=UPI00135AE60D|nr:response regulator [Massilia sp. 9I]